jgi:peptidyl-prolyl cis-trans isomerase B (cyclophilin B)
MHKLITLLFFFVCLMTSCGQNKKNDMVITFKTSYGDMVAILYDETPQHKANFIKLAKEHYFDSILFHRVIKGFMIQSGDSSTRGAQPGQQLGLGGKKYTIPAEINPKFFHEKGALSAARQSDQTNPTKASSGSQFYIVQGTVLTPTEIKNMTYDMNKLMTGLRQMFEKLEYKPLLDSLNKLYYAGDMVAYQDRLIELVPRVEKATGLALRKDMPEERKKIYTTIGGSPHLDGDYTVFGKVIKGLEVIDKIADVPRDQAERPLEDVRVTVTVTEMPKKQITKEYGYVYPVIKK